MGKGAGQRYVLVCLFRLNESDSGSVVCFYENKLEFVLFLQL